jgi:hypothetical protein
MSSTNGLIAEQASSRPGVPYYLSKDEPLLNPSLISPVQLLSADLETAAAIECRGYTAGEPTPYSGAIKLLPGASSVGAAAEGLTIRSVGGGTQVEVGTDGEAPNVIAIAGASGLAQVYDEIYNPVIKGTQVAGSSSALPVPAGPIGAFTFTPTVTGAYMLQVNINVRNADVIPVDGIIEWTLTTTAGEVQYVSNTIKSTSMSKASDFNEVDGVAGALSEPIDYCFSDLCILTAGTQVAFNIFTARASAAGGLPWAIQNYQARLVQCC